MLTKIKSSPSRIKVHELPIEPEAGGESKSMEYPHLYHLRVGDWRISYAVEHNKLVILVLEGLEPDELAREKASKKPRIKIKNLLESVASEPVESTPPASKAARIKLLNLLENVKPEPIEGGEVLKKTKIKLLDLLEGVKPEPTEPETPMPEEGGAESISTIEPDGKPRIKLIDIPARNVKK